MGGYIFRAVGEVTEITDHIQPIQPIRTFCLLAWFRWPPSWRFCPVANLLKSWYGKTGKDFNCNTLYNMCMEKKVPVVINNNTDMKIDKWWITLYSSDLDRKIQELPYSGNLIIAHLIPSGDKLEEWFDENGLCVFCTMSEENMSHLFFKCEIVKRFLEYTLNLSGIAEPLKVYLQTGMR
jgi:hypothetical protein